MKIKSLLPVFICGIVAIASFAQDEDSVKKYIFKRKDTPTKLRPFSCTTYSGSTNAVRTVRGEMVHDAGKDTIVDFQINPLGTTFITIEKNKKPMQKAQVFNLSANDEKVIELNTKILGNPAHAMYTPEGRTLIVVTDRGLYEVDSRTLVPTVSFKEYPGVPDMMLVSPNGYYLVLAKGDKAVVYNLEDKKIRKTVNAGEKINDMAFSPDNSDFAILTDDGVLTLYSTRTFELRKMIDDLGEGRALAYNLDGKYAAVVLDDKDIEVVNLLRDTDREKYSMEQGGVTDVVMVPDANDNTLMTYTLNEALGVRYLPNLEPYYNRLIDEEVTDLMDQWLKMMPGESMEQYRERVTKERREEMRSQFEFEVSTRLAGNILSGAAIVLGAYDRANNVLEVSFENMPSIFLPVPEEEITAFTNASDLKLNEVLFGVTPTDDFEIVYADIFNKANGKNYIFDNRSRVKMDYMKNDDIISLEVLQQQQMAEIKLRELREQVMREAKQQNVISDHTNITVDSRLQPEYDADGKQILNYIVTFTYDVAPGFSAQEDFGPGKYHIEESGSALSMLKIAKEAFEGDLKPYFDHSKKVNVRIIGTADATPIVNGLAYDGIYGEYKDEPVYVEGQLSPVTVSAKAKMKENPQLAFVRALGVKDYLDKNINGFKDKIKDFRYEVNVSKKKGSEFRRVVTEFTFVDAF